jgi:photosystem II stability/assembly factor-like uncharacterized protein
MNQYLNGVAFPDATHGWAVGEDDGAMGGMGYIILVTADGGAHWTVQKDTADEPYYNILYGVAFSDDTHGWAVGGYSPILATSDGGATWTVQDKSATQPAFNGIAFSDATHGWAVSFHSTIVATSTGGN